MQEAGARFGCMRCLIEGVHCAHINRLVYNQLEAFLPRGHALRPPGCVKPRRRTHESIMRAARQAELLNAGKKEKDRVAVQGVKGICVFSHLEYFKLGGPGHISWVLDLPMHVVKVIWQEHALESLLGLRTPAQKAPPVAPEAPSANFDERMARYDENETARSKVVERQQKVILTKAQRKAGDKCYSDLRGPVGFKRNKPDAISRCYSKSIFNSHQLKNFIVYSGLHVFDACVQDDSVCIFLFPR